MRALLINPVLPLSYWSLPQTCEMKGSKTLLPPLGLITVAALLPPEWEVRLVDLNCRPLAEEDWMWADLLMITGMIVQRDGLLDLIRDGKKRGKIVVVGGPYATSQPHEPLKAGADFVVQGEGENTIPLLVLALNEGQRGGIIENTFIVEMSGSPLPRFDLLRFDDYTAISVQTSRGCPFDCEFCDVVNLLGRTPRYKTPEQVIDELDTIYRLGWLGTVFVSDDNFIGNKKHATEILVRMIPFMRDRGYPFELQTQASVNLGRDNEIMNLMVGAGFDLVFIGIETPDEDILSQIGKHQNTGNPMRTMVRSIQEHGLAIIGSFVIGFDNESPGAGERICDFVEKTSIPMVMIELLRAMPGTKLWNRLANEGRLVDVGTFGADIIGDRLNYIPTRPETEIFREYVDAYTYLYDPARAISRVNRCFRSMDFDPPSGLTPRTALNRRELIGLVRIIWRLGIWSPWGIRFLKQMMRMFLWNQLRSRTFIKTGALVHDMIALTISIRQRADTSDGRDGF